MLDLCAVLIGIGSSTWMLKHPLRRWDLLPNQPLFPLVLVFVCYCVVSLFLVRIEQFSVVKASLLLTVVTSILRFISIQLPHRDDPIPPATFQNFRAPPLDWLIVVAIVSLGSIYLFFPTYYLFGGRDPGCYLIQLIHFAKTGGDLFQLTAEGGQYPGFYYVKNLNRLVAQFLHLFPATGATFYSIFGLEGAVRANGFLAIIALLSFFSLVRQLLPRWTSFTATVCLAINPAFLFVARGTYSEVFAVLLFALGTSILLHAVRRNNPGAAVLSGWTLGLMCLNRLDGILISLTAAGIAMAITGQLRSRRKLPFCFGCALAISSCIGFLDAAINSSAYLGEFLKHSKLPWVLAASGLILVVSSILPFLPLGLTKDLQEKFIRLGGALISLGVGGWILYTMVFRPLPLLSTATYEESVEIFRSRSMIELSWYLTIPGFILLLYGLSTLLVGRSWVRWAPILAISIPTFILFTYDPNISPDHPWASRRWVPFVIPTSIAIAAYGGYHFQKLRLRGNRIIPRALITGLVAFYFLSSLNLSRSYLTQSLLKDWSIGLRGWEETIKPLEAAQFFHPSPGTASVLNFVYGIPTISRSPESDSSRSFALERVTGIEMIHGHYPGMKVGTFPSELEDWRIDGDLRFQVPRNPKYAYGQSLVFSSESNSHHYLLDGWANPDAAGVWTTAKTSNLILDLPPTAKDFLELRFSYIPVRPPDSPPASFSVMINGVEIGKQSTDSASGILQKRFLFPQTLLHDDDGDLIQFSFTNLRSLRTRQVSGDNRLLGLHLRTLSISEDPYLVAPGQVIDFSNKGDSEKYTLQGFHTPETWGRWIDGSTGSVAFTLPTGIRLDSVRLIVDIRTHITPENTPLMFEAFIEERSAGKWFISENMGRYSLEIPVPFRSLSITPFIELRFDIANPISPSLSGRSQDNRKLGIGVYSITVLSGPSPNPDP